MPDSLTFYHSPNSRSSGTLALLEELGAPYRMEVLDMKAGEQRGPAYLAVNPMGKVPAILDGDALVTEQAAIYVFLADRAFEAGLAPAIGDRRRGPYLRWFAFYGSCFEPALVDRALKREPGPPAMSPYGDYDTVIETVARQLRAGPYMLGERFTALDVLWGGGLRWTTSFKIVPELPEFMAYISRVTARPSFARAAAIDADLVKRREAEASG